MNLLIEAIRTPSRLSEFTEPEWDSLLRFARHAKMLGELFELIKRQDVSDCIPGDALTLLQADAVRTDYLHLQATHEMEQLSKTIFPCNYPVILLKGAAYLAAGLPPITGRRLSDVDLMVPKENLAETEATLKRAGWSFTEQLSEYDERYYREWSHEIPPMRHPTRAMEVDLHHNLVAPISRIKLDTSLLLNNVIPLEGTGFHILPPTDMYLHSATHLFFNDELRGGLRDLYDLFLLGKHFSQSDKTAGTTFGKLLIERSLQLGMDRPLFYALTSCQRLLDTHHLQLNAQDLEKITPNWFSKKATSLLIDKIIAPQNVEQLHDNVAETLILARANWVRMPPYMLFKHLSYKTMLRLFKREPQH